MLGVRSDFGVSFNNRRRPLRKDFIWVGVMTLGVVTGCDDRSAEEKGRDYVEEKLGLAEGAAQVLEERGSGLGGDG